MLPVAAPPDTCHSAARLHLPPSKALAGPFSGPINREPDAHRRCGQGWGRNPGAVAHHPGPMAKPGAEMLDRQSPPANHSGGATQAQDVTFTHQTLAAQCLDPQPALKELAASGQTAECWGVGVEGRDGVSR